MNPSKSLKQGEKAMSVKLKTRDLPLEGLNPYIILVGKTQNLDVIQKIREVCEPLVKELIQNHLKQLKACTGIFDFDVQMTTNANRETEKLVEERAQQLEEFWQANQQEFERNGFSEENFWSCVEWVPTKHIASLCKQHKL